MNLDDTRRKIDRIDEKLVRLLNRRAENAFKIGRMKADAGFPVHDPRREKEVLKRVRKMNKGPLPRGSIEAIYRRIISSCREVQDGKNPSDC